MQSQQLMALKDKIEMKKRDIEREKGKLESLLEDADARYGCDGLRALKSKISELKSDIETKEKKRDDNMETLESELKESFPELM